MLPPNTEVSSGPIVQPHITERLLKSLREVSANVKRVGSPVGVVPVSAQMALEMVEQNISFVDAL